MKVILLTQYYPPETGAPQNRLSSLSRFLKEKKCEVTVVTAMPNYPENRIFLSYKGRYSVHEIIDNISVHRTWIFVGTSRGIVHRLLNYFSFVFTSFFKLLRLPSPDYIICESPPLFLGITAVLISKIKGSKLIFNVSDLWPESAEKLNIITNQFLISVAYRLEGWIYKNAYLIFGQTKGIVNNIRSRFPSKKVFWFPNGVDFDFFHGSFEEIEWRKQLAIPKEDFILLYAGTIGYAQGLETVLEAAEKLNGNSVTFLIAGDGPEKNKLKSLALEKGLSKVIFIPNLEKKKIPSLVKACDAFVVPLRKLDLFMGAIPSKLFEPLALGKPIILGVAGEAKDLFIDDGKAGLFYEPENSQSLTEQIKILQSNAVLKHSLGEQGQLYVKTNFDRAMINERFFNSL